VRHCPLQQLEAVVAVQAAPLSKQHTPFRHTRPEVVQFTHVPPPVPQFAFAAPALHMAEPELLVPQQPSQLAAEQASTQVHVTGSRSRPAPHSARHAPPHTIGCAAGHSHAQVVGLRVWFVIAQVALGHSQAQLSGLRT